MGAKHSTTRKKRSSPSQVGESARRKAAGVAGNPQALLNTTKKKSTGTKRNPYFADSHATERRSLQGALARRGQVRKPVVAQAARAPATGLKRTQPPPWGGGRRRKTRRGGGRRRRRRTRRRRRRRRTRHRRRRRRTRHRRRRRRTRHRRRRRRTRHRRRRRRTRHRRRRRR